jgi:hypothetical protein
MLSKYKGKLKKIRLERNQLVYGFYAVNFLKRVIKNVASM